MKEWGWKIGGTLWAMLMLVTGHFADAAIMAALLGLVVLADARKSRP
jgi:hypothetical protein